MRPLRTSVSRHKARPARHAVQVCLCSLASLSQEVEWGMGAGFPHWLVPQEFVPAALSHMLRGDRGWKWEMGVRVGSKEGRELTHLLMLACTHV